MSTDLATRKTVVKLVETFQRATEKVRNAYAILNGAEEELDAAFALGSATSAIRARPPGMRITVDWDVEPVVKDMERQAWAAIVERLELRRFMSIAKHGELQEQLRRGKLPPITVEAIADFAEGFRAAAPEMHKAAVLEVFEWLRPGERSHVHKLKTNTELEVGRKVILGWAVEERWSGGGFHVSYGGNHSQRLVALENVLNGLDGKGTVAKAYQSDLETAIGKAAVGETELFRYRCCKNRNLHLEFKRLDLLAKFNAIAGGKTLKPEKGNKSPRSTQAKRAPHVERSAAEMSEKELGFFETPQAVIERMLELAELGHDDIVLEPSAGTGALAVAVRGWAAPREVVCVEIDHGRAEVLRAMKSMAFTVIESDFLALEPVPKFTAILMNPPFHRGADVAHVAHALRWLKPGGTLVSVMSAGVKFRSDALTVEFRRDVEERGGFFEANPEGSFLESGTGVRTVTLVIPRGGAS